jgi:hypothetical protein
MLTSVLSPEAQLLLASGREDEAGARAVRSLLERPINWERLFVLATQEKAAPVLLRTLTDPARGGGPSMPPERLAQLRKLAMVVEFKMLYLKQRLDETIGVLASTGIDGVLLKGAALGCTVYPTIVDRPMGDIDVLVPAERAYEARTMLLAAGWTWKTEVWQDEYYRDHHHLPPLSDVGEGALRLELHTELFIKGHPFLLSGETVRRGSRAVPVRAQCVRVPSPLHQLLHACLHFAWSHSMRVGSWRAFRDVRALTRGGGIAWDEFVATARENRAATCSYWTLRLARDLMGLDVPERTLAALRPPLPTFVLRRLAQHFAVQLFTTEAVCPSVAFEKLMWSAGVMPGWSGHGSSRPWDESEALLETARRAQPAVSGSAKAMRQLRNLGRWGRYARAVLAPAASN